MYRSLAVFVLASSLLAICQTPAGVTVNGGYVAPIMPGAPLVTPPNVALPGSGPATGAPPAVGVNDPRNGGSGSVFQPSAGTLLGTENTGVPTPAPITGTLPPAAGSESNVAPASLNVGVTTFSEAPANQPEVSLGDIARRYKAERANAHPRQFDNNNIRHASYGTEETNSSALPQSDQASATYGSTGSSSVPQGVMNPADYAAVQAALARSQAATNAGSSNTVATAMPDPNRSWSVQSDEAGQPAAPASTNQQQGTAEAQGTTEATTPQIDNQASAPQTNARAKRQLPASSSPLPLIAVLGLIALAAGGIFTRRVRNENR